MKVFNISFPYRESVYNALVTVSGEDEEKRISMRVEQDTIQLILPHGKLVFPIVEVVKYFVRQRERQDADTAMHITDTISLHLMSPNP